MRTGRASWTAMAVAFGRGLGTEGTAPDPLAERLLPPSVAGALRALGGLETRQWPARIMIRGLTLGMVDHVCLRTAAIDQVVRDHTDRGCRQVVLLGAGLDTRAWRMPQLESTTIFEVDHPSTQQHKRERFSDLPAARATIRMVGVDLEHENLSDALRDRDFNPAEMSLWIWEGVTPYLRTGAVNRTLAQIAALTCKGSALAMTYAIGVPQSQPGLARATNFAFWALGEPIHTVMEPSEASQKLREHGFAVQQDTDSRDWSRLAPGSASLAWLFRRERLAVATRIPG